MLTENSYFHNHPTYPAGRWELYNLFIWCCDFLPGWCYNLQSNMHIFLGNTHFYKSILWSYGSKNLIKQWPSSIDESWTASKEASLFVGIGGGSWLKLHKKLKVPKMPPNMKNCGLGALKKFIKYENSPPPLFPLFSLPLRRSPNFGHLE